MARDAQKSAHGHGGGSVPMGNDRSNKGKRGADRDTRRDATVIDLVTRTQAAGAVAAPSPTDSKCESGAMAAL